MCCVYTAAVVGAVGVHFVARSAGADEAGAVQVGALLLTQLLFTGAILAKVCSRTTHNKPHFHQLIAHHFSFSQSWLLKFRQYQKWFILNDLFFNHYINIESSTVFKCGQMDDYGIK